MDDSGSDTDVLSAGPEVASILGIKGSLRFRPHGSSQKAHVVLRRVEIADDSSDDEGKSVVYFSLFAQKRIEVKPGKEILLALPPSAGRFQDQAVIFEGDMRGAENASDEEEDALTPAAEEEPVILPSRDILPPKKNMRRTWSKRIPEQVSPIELCPPPPPPLVYTSVAVQAEPTCVAASVQTIASPRVHASSATQTREIVRDVFSVIVQTDSVAAEVSHESHDGATTTPDADEVGSTRSLSPMELDSPSSTPPHSPIFPLASSLPAFDKSPEWPKPVPATLGSNGQAPAHLFEPDYRGTVGAHRSFSPRSTTASQTAQTPLSGGKIFRQTNQSVVTHLPPTGPASLRSLTVNTASSVEKDSNRPGSFGPVVQGPTTSASTLRTSPGSYVRVDDEDISRASPTSTSSIPAKRKPVVQNPFVSAGFMTEFVGSSVPKKTPESPQLRLTSQALPASTRKPTLPPLVIEGQRSRASSTSSMEESPISPTKSFISKPVLPPLITNIASREASLSPMEQSSVSSSSCPSPQSSDAPRKSQSPKVGSPTVITSPQTVISDGDQSPSSIPGLTQSATIPIKEPETRQSNLLQIFVPSVLRQSVPTAAQTSTVKLPLFTARNQPQVQPTTTKPVNIHPLPPRPADPTHSSHSRPLSIDATRIQGSSPPPDPRSLAYISSGPSSNPLGIRPSSRPGISRILSQPSTSTSQQKNKKPIVVGNGWPYTRPTGGVNSIPLGTSNLSSSGLRTQVHTVQTKTRPVTSTSHDLTSSSTSRPPVTLTNILSYSSPSPPPLNFPSNPSSGLQLHSVTKGNRIKSPTSAHPANGHPRGANSVTPEIPGLKYSGSNPIKVEPVEVQLPPSAGLHSTSRKDPTFSKSPPRSVKDSIPRGPRDSPSSIQSGPLAKVTARNIAGGADANTPPSQKITGTSIHPLPPKPSLTSRISPRGVKRGVSPLTQELKTVRPAKRSFQWPTVESTHRVRIKGDGDVSIQGIAFSSDGSQFAVNCNDRTVRIWNNRNHTEIARLAHNSSILAVAWMQGDAGIVSLADDGVVSKWTRTGQNHWQWAKILDAGIERGQDEETVCFAYNRDRIAVAFPRVGVKVWLWLKGTWQPQRSILRQNVSSIKFVEEGNALLGGTRDGVLWYCEVPNGTLRAYTFLKSRIYHLDVNSSGSSALVAQVGGRAHLVTIIQNDNKGKIEQVYAIKDEELIAKMKHEFGAVFANQGQTVLFGSMEGCVLVWDKHKGNIICALDHCEDDIIQTIAVFDRNTSATDCSLITGTKQGLLNWWSQPPMPDPHLDDTSNKRRKPSPKMD